MVANDPKSAKELQEQRIEKAISRYGIVTNEFNNRAQEQQSDNSRQSSGSEMVKNDKPEAALKPEQSMRAGPDREAFEKKWQNEQDQANQKDREYGPER